MEQKYGTREEGKRFETASDDARMADNPPLRPSSRTRKSVQDMEEDAAAKQHTKSSFKRAGRDYASAEVRPGAFQVTGNPASSSSARRGSKSGRRSMGDIERDVAARHRANSGDFGDSSSNFSYGSNQEEKKKAPLAALVTRLPPATIGSGQVDEMRVRSGTRSTLQGLGFGTTSDDVRMADNLPPRPNARTRRSVQDMEEDAAAKQHAKSPYKPAGRDYASAEPRPGAFQVIGNNASSSSARRESKSARRSMGDIEQDVEAKLRANSGDFGDSCSNLSYGSNKEEKKKSPLSAIEQVSETNLSPRHFTGSPTRPARSSLQSNAVQIDEGGKSPAGREGLRLSGTSDLAALSSPSRLEGQATLTMMSPSRLNMRRLENQLAMRKATSQQTPTDSQVVLPFLPDIVSLDERTGTTQTQTRPTSENSSTEPNCETVPNHPVGASHVASSGLIANRNPGALPGQPAYNEDLGAEQSIFTNRLTFTDAIYTAECSSDSEEVRPVIDTEAVHVHRHSSQEQARQKLKGDGRNCLARRKTLLSACVLLMVGTIVAISVAAIGKNSDPSLEATESPSQILETMAPTINPSLLLIQDMIDERFPTQTGLSDTETPQLAAMNWLVSDTISWDILGMQYENSTNMERVFKRYSLAVFYYSLDGDNWYSSTGWLNPDLDECDWAYLSCDEKGEITTINTGNSQNLIGTVPSEIEIIDTLRELRLPGNEVKWLLASLDQLVVLDISNNLVQMELVDFLYNMTKLTYLDISSNEIYGTISSSIEKLTSLEEVYLSNNLLSGTVPELNFAAGSLEILEAKSNRFSGQFHDSFRDLPNLRILNVEDNMIGGTIGDTIQSLSSLELLIADGNAIGGSLPIQIGLLDQLTTMRLGRNSLSGELPTQLASLSFLREINFQENMMTGMLPAELGLLENLETLELSANLLAGSIPTSLGDLTKLVSLDLSVNSFDGTIPTELGQCSSLVSLRLQRNDLEGGVPTEMSMISQLDLLRLDGNKGLDGSLADAICDMEFLTFISVPCGVTCPCVICRRCA